MTDPTFGGGEQVSDRRLAWGIWFANHRTILTKLGYVALIAVGAVSWSFTLWGILNHYALDGLDLRRGIAQMATATNERATILARQRPEDVRIAEVTLVPSGAGVYDVAARVVNANARWLVTAEYTLSVPGAEDIRERTVLLPGQERWLTRLNVRSTASPTRAGVVLHSLAWRRIRHDDISDVAAFVGDRFRIEVRDVQFRTPQELMVGGAGSAASGAPIAVSRATFTVENLSAYEVRDLELVVLLSRGGGIVGVNRIVVDALPAGSRRSDAATWFTPMGLVQRVLVVPYANVFVQK